MNIDIVYFLLLWSFCCLSVVSLHYLWYLSDLLPSITMWLAKIGWIDTEALPDDVCGSGFVYWSKIDWNLWIILRWGSFLGKLITCPLCGCYHFSFLGGVALAVMTHRWEAIPIAWLSYPALIRKLNNL